MVFDLEITIKGVRIAVATSQKAVLFLTVKKIVPSHKATVVPLGKTTSFILP